MALWIGLAIVTAAVLVALVGPLLRPGPAPRPSASLSEAGSLYRDQLRELDGDLARGAISDADHQASRAEIARRLLAAETDRDQVTSPGAMPATGAWAIALALISALPLAAVAIYLHVGAPGLPAQPHAARLQSPIAQARVDDLIRAVELRLRNHPEDGQGWDVIAPVYLKQGRFREAADAYARAARLLGDTPKRLSGFAEATVLDNDGIVTEPARLAYEKLAALEPSRPEPRFWLAVAMEQDGRLDAAVAAYEALVRSAPSGAPWLAHVIERRDAALKRLGGAAPAPPARPARSTPEPESGPSAADIAAADKLSPVERRQMIDAMVEGLADRLRRDGRDLSGWERLIRAYSVMGRREEAAAALREARRNMAAEPASLAKLAELAKSLGLES